MKRLTRWLLVCGFLMLTGNAATSEAAKPLRVVATLTTFADLVKTIGGDQVEVTAIAPPQFNPHFIEPKPSDVLRVKRADLLVHAGLDLELWRGPLLDAAGNTKLFPGQPGELDLSQGIALLEVPTHTVSRSEGDIHLFGNPHYWVDPENAIIIAKTIATKLSEIDPEHASMYDERMRAWTRHLGQRMDAWHQQLAPYQGQELVGYHNEWPYLMRFAGLKMEQFLEPKPGIPPTPKQIEFLQRYMTAKHVRGVVQSPYFPPQAAQALTRRTGAKIVLLCQSVREVKEATDYLAMIEYNVVQLIDALR